MILDGFKVDKTSKKMVEEAIAVLDKSFCPLSGWSVAAAVLAIDNQNKLHLFTGINLETSAGTSIIHAEQAAIAAAMTGEWARITRVVVVSSHSSFKVGPRIINPCGTCLQLIWELSRSYQKDISVLVVDSKTGRLVKKSISTLLPHPCQF